MTCHHKIVEKSGKYYKQFTAVSCTCSKMMCLLMYSYRNLVTYYDGATMMAVKSFIVHAPEEAEAMVQKFMAVNYDHNELSMKLQVDEMPGLIDHDDGTKHFDRLVQVGH